MKYAYQNGNIIGEDKAVVSIRTHAFNYGTSALEGIRAFYQKDDRRWNIFKPADHYKRLKSSSEILNLEMPVTEDEFLEILAKLLRCNDIRNTIYFRPILYANNQGVGVSNKTGASLAIYIEESPVAQPKYVRCYIVNTIRTPSSAIPARGRICGSYVNNYLAQNEAMMKGYDCALMLSSDRFISEAYGMNIFMVKNNAIYTPSLDNDILPGITRDSLIHLIKTFTDIKVTEGRIDREFLTQADEAFICGTGSAINVISSINDIHIGNGRMGDITGKVNQLYLDAVSSKTSELQQWCVRVYPRNPENTANGKA
jgi:branched-chain amino acid aminotransferase